MNSIWFPNLKHAEPLDFLFDSTHSDFEQQAALKTDIGLTYTQLTGGRFRGRVFSARLANTSIHMEYLSLAMECEVKSLPHKFSFCIALRQTSPLEPYGVVGATDYINIVPPGGKSVAIAPPNSLLLVFTIDSRAFLDSAGLVPEVAEWLLALSAHGVVLQAPRLASRMRADLVSALESAVKSETSKKRAIVDRAIIFSVASALTMEWVGNQTLSIRHSTQAFERFRHVRNLLMSDVAIFSAPFDERLGHLGSKRSIEQAFTQHVSMGPLAYARLIRLHNARSKLRSAEHEMKSIGDIAAEEGFWDASRFAAHYRRHFGELPSATRERPSGV
ncbi:MAG: helix-turn-helix domain-containing protein [Alphaproteobacteria bacterium]|nr:helix-turn-helix domain-containing protein [Alphaproteobacteria bacterium]